MGNSLPLWKFIRPEVLVYDEMLGPTMTIFGESLLTSSYDLVLFFRGQWYEDNEKGPKTKSDSKRTNATTAVARNRMLEVSAIVQCPIILILRCYRVLTIEHTYRGMDPYSGNIYAAAHLKWVLPPFLPSTGKNLCNSNTMNSSTTFARAKRLRV